MDATDRLRALGYEPVVGGERGSVFLPSDGGTHAIKLFPADDVAYLSFVRYALDHPSPHLPRILHGPVEADDGWAVVLERLEEPDASDAEGTLDEVEGFLLAVLNGDADTTATDEGDWGHPLPESLKETLLGIGLILLRGHGFIPDPSSGNVLGRDGVPVLSDVVCGRNGRPYAARAELPFDPDLDALLRDPAPSP